MREKVTDSWRWSGNGVTKKWYPTLLKSLAEELAAPAAKSGRSIAIRRAEGNGPPLKLGRRIAKRVRTGLGRKADFSYWQCYESQVS
jgi:hypothetical protein